MNRRQEIAAWVFGGLIALGLVATDNAIWALALLAALTILSLRDRQKKKRRSDTPDNPSKAGAAAESPERPLKNLTPHILATVMLQRRAEGVAPFQMWREPASTVEIPPEADAVFAIACEFYQLRVFLDLLKQRFGSGICKLVETSIATILDEVRDRNVFSRVNAAILYARALGPANDGPKNPQLRIDLQVADQLLGGRFIFNAKKEQSDVRNITSFFG